MREPLTVGTGNEKIIHVFLLLMWPARMEHFITDNAMDSRLCLTAHDEMFIIDLQKVLYFEADDHYAHVYYASGTHFMVPYGLSKIEAALAQKGDEAEALQRMGRKYIVNTRRIFRVNTITETISLSDDQGGNTVLHISKTVLRAFLDSIIQPCTAIDTPQEETRLGVY